MDWFRMYGEMIDDPKIGTLDDAAFRTWVELLCAACKAEDGGNTRLKQADMNWVFRRNADVTLQQLLQRELVTTNETEEIVITKWEQRQKKSDSSADRVRAHRAKAKQDKELAEGNATETLQKQDANGLEKKREEKKEDMSGQPDASEVKTVLDYLNATTGSSYRPVESNLKLVRDRLKSGATLEQCKAVIDAKVDQWGSDPKMAEYLRPTTLFRASNFEQYLGQLAQQSSANAAEAAIAADGATFIPGVGRCY